MEEIMEINQNLQVFSPHINVKLYNVCMQFVLCQTDAENMREELQFKDHKLNEWENLLRTERDKIKSLENELKVSFTKVIIKDVHCVCTGLCKPRRPLGELESRSVHVRDRRSRFAPARGLS